MQRQVKDLIQQAGLSHFARISPKGSILEALKILDLTKSSALLVIENNLLKGIFSEKDFSRAVVKRGIRLTEKVETIMTSKIYFADMSNTLEDCLQIMYKVHVRHLPIIKDGVPVALISMRHIMEALVKDKDTQIRDLTTYITGTSIAGSIASNENKILPAQIPTLQSGIHQGAL